MDSDNNGRTGKGGVRPGTLYLVGTPIGNLGDLSERVLETLRSVDRIAAEDTRRTRTLMTRFDIHKPLASYHAHNLRSKGEWLVGILREGQAVALVSDAGMPAISDPGADMVRLCVEADIPVVVVPGPCAAVAGLAGSGLDTARFVFEGFLPADKKERRLALARVSSEPRTVVLYEAPHRLLRTLGELAKAGMGDRHLSVGRELTKMHEEFVRGTVDRVLAHFTDTPPRGEFVLVAEGCDAYGSRTGKSSGNRLGAADLEWTKERILEKVTALVGEGLPVKEISRQVSSETGIPRKEAYSMALSVRNGPADPLKTP